MEFKTINKNAVSEVEEKKSHFIGHLYYIEDFEKIEKYLKLITNQYNDAKHNCYAYTLKTKDDGLIIKYDDDGEPSGTAGSAMLKILLEKGLSNVLIIVTRYFGGTLLGTGGLVRAYSNTLIKALQQVEYVKKQSGYEVELEIEYGDLENFKYFCNKNSIKIINMQYGEKVKIFVEICKKMEEEFTKNGNKEKFNIITHKITNEKYVDK